MSKALREFLSSQTTGGGRYVVEQFVFFIFQWIPGIVGLVMRMLVYRFLIDARGFFGIEENVRICHSRQLRLSENTYVGRNVFLGASGGGIAFGAGVRVLDGCYLNVFNYGKGAHCGKIVLEENVVLSAGCKIHGHSGVSVGRNTILGPGTVIVSGNHGPIADGTNFRFTSVSTETPVVIGENVWIGANVTILPGVTIGNHVVVGAGSVVNKNVDGNTVVVGNPARLLRPLDPL